MIDAVSKLIIDGMKLSLLRMERIVFQSGMTSLSLVTSNSKQIDSKANLTMAGGFAIDLTSDNCFFLIPLTATGSDTNTGTHTHHRGGQFKNKLRKLVCHCGRIIRIFQMHPKNMSEIKYYEIR